MRTQKGNLKTQNYRIPDLRPGEGIVLLQHQHPAMLFRGLMWPVLLLIAWLVSLVFVIPFIGGLVPDPLGPPAEGVALWLPVALWAGWIAVAVAFCVWAMYLVFEWRDDWVALTTRRLIIMDKLLFFREKRSEVPLGSVQNVSADYPNSLAVALDFGNLAVDTAGTGLVIFEHMPRPRLMRELIFAQQQALRAQDPPPEKQRKAAVRDILQGPDAVPHAPLNPEPPSPSITWHRHWAFLARGLVQPSVVWLLLLVAWLLSLRLDGQGQFGFVAVVMGWIVVLGAPVCLLWAAYNGEDWRNDIYRVDQERVYVIESLPFGLRERSKETLITRITDVSYVVPGPLAHLLDYGDVVLKTPGESTEFVFKGIPHPRQVQQQIMLSVDDYRRRAKTGTTQEMEAWLKAYHDVLNEGV